MKVAADIAVVGAGCFGALAALVAARCGHSVVLVERGSHPRFAIGESSTPLANLLLESLAERHGLPELASLSKWGTWRRRHPELRCGKKRGFTFLAHPRGAPFAARDDLGDQLLVAASPHDAIADTHWHRGDLDQHLVNVAIAHGVQYLDRTELDRPECSWDGCRLVGRRGREAVELDVRLVIDASGPRGYLWRQLDLGSSTFPHLPETASLFTHFEGVRKLEGSDVYPFAQGLPYPPDAAAVHHVLPDGWVWSLGFDDGRVSAGVAAAPALAEELRLDEGERAWRRLLARQPSLERLFASAQPVEPFVHLDRVPFRVRQASGAGWILLPSAAAFVDPLLSTGFPLALLGVLRLGDVLRRSPLTEDALATPLDELARRTLAETDRAASLIAALYTQFEHFDSFRALSRLYFAAVIFAETRIHLGFAPATEGFLGLDHPTFRDALEHSCATARSLPPGPSPERDRWLSTLATAIEPLDVVGLGRPEFQAWLPVDLDVLLSQREKLGATREQILEMVERCELR